MSLNTEISLPDFEKRVELLAEKSRAPRAAGLVGLGIGCAVGTVFGLTSEGMLIVGLASSFAGRLTGRFMATLRAERRLLQEGIEPAGFRS